MSARRFEAASNAALFSSLLFSSLLALSREAAAQKSVTGVWSAAFDHENSGPNATDYMAAYPGGVLLASAGLPGGWGDPGTDKFNAIHMSLIPKGPYRGQVLVWNRYPVFMKPPFDPANWWAFQAWSIVNPEVTAPAPRFRNYLLPVFQGGPTITNPQDAADLFCTGHAWTAEGDLVIAGGAKYTYDFTQGVINELGARFLYMLDLARPSAVEDGILLPGGAMLLYPNPSGPPTNVGHWRRAADLQVDRYYPTVVMTHRLARLNPNSTETMLVAGGSDRPLGAAGSPGNPSNPRNTFESFRVRDSLNLNFLEVDWYPTINDTIFFGPGTLAGSSIDWLLEYPRLHLLTDGTISLSGYVPNAARLNPETLQHVWPAPPAPALERWDSSIGLGSTSTWNQLREDGSSAFFAKVGAIQDLVVRLGGSAGVSTDSSEFCFASQALPVPAGWVSLGTMPGGGRDHSNAAVLADGSILVVGGDGSAGPVRQVCRYTPATGWTTPTDSPTVRDYHATMVLCAKGQVIIGGGEGRTTPGPFFDPHEYDVYEPGYMHGPPRPYDVTLPFTAPTVDAWGQRTFPLSFGQSSVRLTVRLEGMDYLDRVVLLAPGSITHHSDMSARFVELDRVIVDSNTVDFSMPLEKVLLRGYYMLFALTGGGIPSEAIWVKVQ